MSLISVDQLAARLDRDDAPHRLRVLDVRWYLNKPDAGRAAYDAGHIPGAIFADLETGLSDPDGLGAPGRHPLPTPAAFRTRMEALGIGTQMLVVGYDDGGGTTAARLWWMLDNLGHRGGAAVLDGGLQAWNAAGLALSTDEPRYPHTALELRGEWHHVIKRADLAARLDYMTVLDARAGERYRGETEPIDLIPGHIPGAVSAPATINLDATGRFLPPDELRARFDALATGKPFVTSCGSGVVACHNALAMRQAGLPDPILYAGSYSDWTRSGLPTEPRR
ncbi:MAG: sulfurtransferase [Candidatus Limnocylindrales bacterium]